MSEGYDRVNSTRKKESKKKKKERILKLKTHEEIFRITDKYRNEKYNRNIPLEILE